jgi:hypothetical protein
LLVFTLTTFPGPGVAAFFLLPCHMLHHSVVWLLMYCCYLVVGFVPMCSLTMCCSEHLWLFVGAFFAGVCLLPCTRLLHALGVAHPHAAMWLQTICKKRITVKANSMNGDNLLCMLHMHCISC